MENIREFNFTQVSNGRICACGRHHGVGNWTPEERAAIYARQRDVLASYYTPHMKNYVSTWEAAHGKIAYKLVQAVGSNGQPYDTPEFIKGGMHA